MAAPEKLLAGNPKQCIWNHYTDASAKFSAGEWYSEVGKWKVHYTEEEYCQIIEGVSIVTNDGGRAVTLIAGDRLVVNAPENIHAGLHVRAVAEQVPSS